MALCIYCDIASDLANDLLERITDVIECDIRPCGETPEDCDAYLSTRSDLNVCNGFTAMIHRIVRTNKECGKCSA